MSYKYFCETPAKDRSAKPGVRCTCAKAGLETPACRNGSTGRDSLAPIFIGVPPYIFYKNPSITKNENR